MRHTQQKETQTLTHSIHNKKHCTHIRRRQVADWTKDWMMGFVCFCFCSIERCECVCFGVLYYYCYIMCWLLYWYINLFWSNRTDITAICGSTYSATCDAHRIGYYTWSRQTIHYYSNLYVNSWLFIAWVNWTAIHWGISWFCLCIEFSDWFGLDFIVYLSMVALVC